MRELKPPKEHYRSPEEWIHSAGLDHNKRLKSYYKSDPIHLRQPKGLEQPVHWMYRAFESQKWRQRKGYVVIMPGGRICRSRCTILTPDHKEMWDLSWLVYRASNDPELQKLRRLPPVCDTAETVALLGMRESGIYYHWMVDVLPRFHMLRMLGIPADKYVLNGGWLAPFQLETLDMLGIPRDRLVYSDDNMHLKAKLLLVPGCEFGIVPKWALGFVRHELMEKPGIRPSGERNRLFISRARASKRKLLNEAELMNHLSKRGFRSVELETMPVAEQIKLFASAEIVIGPHGAGLTNLLFCKPGTKVIELFSPNHMHTCYPVVSHHTGLEHYYLVGIGDRPPEFVNPRIHADDIQIDPKQFRSILKLAGIT
ncbi:glycosyltransferase family 61 protein [Paenibacillus ginsengarvi]|nr:glycosyltransferase family 61 protein [Paenibacillus ginsengarvi]